MAGHREREPVARAQSTRRLLPPGEAARRPRVQQHVVEAVGSREPADDLGDPIRRQNDVGVTECGAVGRGGAIRGEALDNYLDAFRRGRGRPEPRSERGPRRLGPLDARGVLSELGEVGQVVTEGVASYRERSPCALPRD